MKRNLLFAALFAAIIAQLNAQNGLNLVKPVLTNSDLVINIGEITQNAIFFPVDVDGTRIEVIAVRAADGTVRTAFNTCQSCYASGRGFYKQNGSVLVCQNCGKRFRMSQVEVRSGGCNPVPIFAQNKRISTDTIIIPLAFLREAKGIFARWSRN